MGIATPRMAGLGRLLHVVEELHAPPAVLAVAGELVAALVNLAVSAIDAAGDKERALP